MKSFLAICFVMLSATTVSAQKKVKVTVEWVFTGIIENYDHNSRMEIFVDGTKVATSSVTKQSKKNSVTVKVPKGNHTLKVVNFAEYNGIWEEHSRANDYSLDGVYILNTEFKKKEKISLEFDITTEKVIEK